ncbi:unnamed protein product [Nippostrongylus brasiliensis]|uniref:DX domain-containing protein n=1 Tax=Nippostrongylus brasiliensis TaxID=27835 RepID=A0A0N4XEE2_NIPBR|nr:unnamed protein product [Nippostrongylus brasiliensis]
MQVNQKGAIVAGRCKETPDCDKKDILTKLAGQEYVCQLTTLCYFNANVDCPMGGRKGTASCSIHGQECSNNEYCDVNGCCGVPFSKSAAKEATSYITPTGIANLSIHRGKPDELSKGAYAARGKFGKPCKTNADCEEGNFCDKIMFRDHKNESEKLMKQVSAVYSPQMCFPAPRCAGLAYRKPDLGVEFCTNTTSCTYENAFCDTESNKEGIYEHVGICCIFDCTHYANKTASYGGHRAYAKFTKNNALCTNNNDCDSELCINATDQGEPEPGIAKADKGLMLCCTYAKESEENVYKCPQNKKALKDIKEKIIKCKNDTDCNRVAGHVTDDPSMWKYECIRGQIKGGENYCCP